MERKIIAGIVSLALAIAVAPGIAASDAPDEREAPDRALEETFTFSPAELALGDTLVIGSDNGELFAQITDASSFGLEDNHRDECAFALLEQDACQTGSQVHAGTYAHGIAISTDSVVSGDFQSIYTEEEPFTSLSFSESVTCSVAAGVLSGDIEADCTLAGSGPASGWAAQHFGFAFPNGGADGEASGEQAFDDGYAGGPGWIVAPGEASAWIEV